MENSVILPKISFIVTCYNKEKFIEDCLLSIKNQSYPHKELIVVDDCSTDGSFEILKNFEKNCTDLTVKIIRNERNKGQLASFLNGLENAEGEFVTLTDGDDMLCREFAAAHIKTHLNTVVAMTSCRQIEIDENNVVHSLKSTDCPFVNLSDFSENVKFENNIFSKDFETKNFDVKFLSNKKYTFSKWHWSPSTSAVMRKSACEPLLLIKNPSKIKITADKFIFSFVHLMGSSALINAPLYAYRRHDDNYSLANKVMGNKKYLNTRTQKKYIRNNLLIRKEMWNFITENREYFLKMFNRASYLGILKKIIFSFDLSTVKSAVKSLWV